MKKIVKRMLCVLVGFSLFTMPAFGGVMSNQELMQHIQSMQKRLEQLESALRQKDREIEEIKANKSEGGSEASSANWSDRVTFSGAVELDYSYADDSNTGSNIINDSTSDLDIGTVELGVEVAIHDYVTGNMVLKGEGLDGDDRVFWDEASITIQKEGTPVYFIGGKRGQPFGGFESHLINDPVTQELYEVADTGVTVGFTPGVFGLDLSATVYKGEVLMTKMLDGAYGLNRTYLDPTATLPAWRAGGMGAFYAETDDVSSFIGNITLSPAEGLALSVFYDSEPGDGQRNNTLGGMFHYEISKFTLDAEYITAIQREKDSVTGKEHEESAWAGSVAYHATDVLELAARYEAFDDDIVGEQDGNLESRYGLGFTYTLFEKDGFSTALMGEYRKSRLEKAAGSLADDDLDEIFARLAISF